jgi:ABC-type multidrug transport system fused ATPase/permease subunit
MYLWDVMKDFSYKNKFAVILYVIFAILAFISETVAIPRIYAHLFNNLGKNVNLNNIFYLLIGAWIFFQIANTGFNTYMIKLAPKFYEYIHNYMYENLLKNYENDYKDLKLGSIISKFTTIPNSLKDVFIDFVSSIFPRTLVVIIITIYYFFINWQLGLITLVGIILFILIFKYNYKEVSNDSIDRHEKFEELLDFTQDKLSNLMSVYTNGDIDVEIINRQKNVEDYTNIATKSISSISKLQNLLSLNNIIFFIILSIVTFKLYKSNKINRISLMSVYVSLLYLSTNAIILARFFPIIMHYFGLMNNAEEFLKEINRNINKEKAVDNKFKNLKFKNGHILFNNVTFNYPNKKPIYNNINLDIHPEQITGIIGNSGSGKSSLIKIILGLYKIQNGQVIIDNQDISKIKPSILRKNLTVINQNTKLFDTTIYDNIKYGAPYKMTDEDVDLLVKDLRLTKIFSNLQDGFNTKVGVDGNELSGGQKQIIHLLRGFLKNNKILILDEPTSSIDIYHKQVIVELIKKISKNKTVIIISHDKQLFSLYDRIIEIEKGKIISDKTYNL